MKYDVNYFIKKFKAIPNNKWGTGSYHREGKSCALGHCNEYGEGEIARGLRELISKYKVEPISIITINDGHDGYERLGNHPKERVLTLLYNIKECGDVE